MPAGRGKTMHEQIASILRDRISYGVYPENQMLPPEMLLLAEFNVSRHTIREAMRALVAEGLIERSPGRGTMVSPRSRLDGTWGIKSINDLVGEFTQSQIVVLKRGLVPARQFPRIAALFSPHAGASLYRIQRVMSFAEGPVALHRLYTRAEYAARLPKEKIGTEPLIGLIEEHCRVQAFRTRQTASATAANAEVSKLLGVRIGTPMLLLRRIYMSRDETPIEYTELVCRPDRYQQTVDFHRTGALTRKPRRAGVAASAQARARRRA